MTIEQVRQRVAEIEQTARDYEAAHALEDALYRDVLRAIASGVGGDALAAEALKAGDIRFQRVCA